MIRSSSETDFEKMKSEKKGNYFFFLRKVFDRVSITMRLVNVITINELFGRFFCWRGRNDNASRAIDF
jgi:hypothetical protein